MPSKIVDIPLLVRYNSDVLGDRKRQAMVKVTFKYRDAWSTKSEWRTRTCIVSSVEECIRLYGLDEWDVEYEILSVEKVKSRY